MKNKIREGVFICLLLISLDIWAAGSSKLSSIINVMTDIGNSIKDMSELSGEIENDISKIMEILDSNMKFYEDTGCDSNPGTQGCTQAKAKIAEHYTEMMEVIKTKLPSMRKSLEKARNSIVSEMSARVSTKSVNYLQEHILKETSGQGPVVESKNSYSSKRMSGVRLSSRFEQYYNLINASKGKQSEPMSVTAASVLLDMQDSLKYIDYTLSEIEEQRAQMQITASLGEVTPEMKKIVGGIQTILFGKSIEMDEDNAPHNIEFKQTSTVDESWQKDLGLKRLN